jgi:hypothetical protein
MDCDGCGAIGVLLQCDDAFKAELRAMADDECGFSVAQFLHWGAAAMHFVRGILIHGGHWH